MPSDTDEPRTRSRGTGDPGADAIGPGRVLHGRYRLDAVVGRGGTATVYRATDELLGRTVAVKMFAPHLTEPVMVARQRLEMRLIAGLQHPHLVAVYDARMADGASAPAESGYLVLEFVGGPNLSTRLQDSPLTSVEVAKIGIAMASALALVHQAGLVHRDIKPANILLTVAGEPKLSDFGIARELHAERITHSADVLGTAPYLSPEQASGGKIGPATDIYALGLVLLECLTGHREFPGQAVEAAVARLLRDPVVPETLPQPWPGLLRSMTAAEPDGRPMAKDVAAALAAMPGSAPTPSAGDGASHDRRQIAAGGAVTTAAEPDLAEPTLVEPSRAGRPAPVWRLLLAAAAILALGVAALIALFDTQDQISPPTSVPSVAESSSNTPGNTVTDAQPVQATGSSAPAEPTVAQPSQTEPSQTEPSQVEPSQAEPAAPATTPAASEPAAQAPSGANAGNGNGNNDNGNGNGNDGNNGNNGNSGNNGNGNGNSGNNGNGNNGNGNDGSNGNNGNNG